MIRELHVVKKAKNPKKNDEYFVLRSVVIVQLLSPRWNIISEPKRDATNTHVTMLSVNKYTKLNKKNTHAVGKKTIDA